MSDTRFSIFSIARVFSRLTETNLMEQFVDRIREFAASIVNFKPFKNELRILIEITGKMVTVKLQSRRECMYIIHLIFPRTFLLGIKLSDIRSQPWCKQRS